MFRGRAAEVCSAEATELPVRERPPVSVANGLCHPLVMTRYIVGSLTTLLPMVFSNLYPADLVDPVIRVLSSISPFHGCYQKTGSRLKHALDRDDKVYSLVWFVSWSGCRSLFGRGDGVAC